ncbi:MAG: amino acid ABC transporter permease [Chloroflexota bacterium]|nr:amino acid ABC transporter permease [Chloroflexota bacterium]
MPELGWLFNVPVLRFLLIGLGYTLALAALSITISFALGMLLALGRLSRFPLIRYPATLYIEIIRSLPLLLIIAFTFFGLPQIIGVQLEPFQAGVIALSGFTAALLAEIIRSGILSVNRGLIEAAQSQGFTGVQVLGLVTLPIALRRMTPAIVSQFITLLKDTSLTAIIGILELTRRGRIISSQPPFEPIPVFALIAVIYFLVNYGLSLVSRGLEERQA